jgi:hypothetical protein
MSRPKNGTTWKTPEGVMLAVVDVLEHTDVFQPEHNNTFVSVLYLNAPDNGLRNPALIGLASFNEHMTQVGIMLTEDKRPRHPWEVYLADRADGCKGHFAIARWHPSGYQEVWNLRKHTWGAFSDDVLTLEEAEKMLQSISFHPMTPSIRSPV